MGHVFRGVGTKIILGAELEVQLASHRPGIKINMGWAGVRTITLCCVQ